jgi:hypothetical protein
MKAGDLVRVVQGGSLVPAYLGAVGVILGSYRNEQAPDQKWFRVQVEHRELKMHESYLEVISHGDIEPRQNKPLDVGRANPETETCP